MYIHIIYAYSLFLGQKLGEVGKKIASDFYVLQYIFGVKKIRATGKLKNIAEKPKSLKC